MIKVHSLKRTIIIQFVVILLPIAAVLSYLMVAESQRTARVDRLMRQHSLALVVRDRYFEFANGAVDAVDTGALSKRALLALQESRRVFVELVRETPSLNTPDTQAILREAEQLEHVLQADASLGKLRVAAPRIARIKVRVAEMRQLLESRLDQAIRESIDESRHETRIILLVVAVVGLLTVLFIVRMIRYLTRPLSTAVSIANRIAQNMPVDDAEFHRHGDIGDLLKSLWHMFQSLQRYKSEADLHQRGLQEKLDALAHSEASLAEAQNLAHVGNWHWNPATGDMHWSEEMYRLLGLAPGKQAPGMAGFLACLSQGGAPELAERIQALAHASDTISLEYTLKDATGVERTLFCHCSSESGGGGVIRVCGTLQDVTQRKRAEEEIRRLALYDSLTGLPNRRFFHDQLERGIAWAKRSNGRLATVFVDLDRFKRINDTLGHAVGDELLKEVSRRLQTCVRGTDYVSREALGERMRLESGGAEVARLGGDEFTVTLAGLDTPESAAKVARRMLSELAKPVIVDRHELTVTCSIGIAVYPDDGEDAATLLKNADAAMYQAKNLGKNTYQFFRKELNAQACRKLSMEGELRHAIERDQLLLYYQPKIDSVSGAISGAEGLVRWQHPQWGLIPPAQFIPLAEEMGLIVDIGDWVMKEAAQQLGRWHLAGFNAGLAINLAAPSFHQTDLVANVSKLLEAHQLQKGAFTIEVTESLLIKDSDSAISTLAQLRELGVRISMDDFGTGYSSLSYLRRLPIDQLKIDRSFIMEITESPDDAAIVAAIIALAHSLRLEVVAEGVETLPQAHMLRAQGCPTLQGYYFSRPVPIMEFEAMLMRGNEYADKNLQVLCGYPRAAIAA